MSEVVTLERELNQMILSGEAWRRSRSSTPMTSSCRWLRDAGETTKS